MEIISILIVFLLYHMGVMAPDTDIIMLGESFPEQGNIFASHLYLHPHLSKSGMASLWNLCHMWQGLSLGLGHGSGLPAQEHFFLNRQSSTFLHTTKHFYWYIFYIILHNLFQISMSTHARNPWRGLPLTSLKGTYCWGFLRRLVQKELGVMWAGSVCSQSLQLPP